MFSSFLILIQFQIPNSCCIFLFYKAGAKAVSQADLTAGLTAAVKVSASLKAVAKAGQKILVQGEYFMIISRSFGY